MFSPRVVTSSEKVITESVNWKTYYKKFAGVSYAEIVKYHGNKKVNNNHVKNPGKVTAKADSVKGAYVKTREYRGLKKHSSVIVPSQKHKSACHSKPQYLQTKYDNIPTNNRFNMLQNLDENKELDKSYMNVNTEASANVKHVDNHSKFVHEETQKHGVNKQSRIMNVGSGKANEHTSNIGKKKYEKTVLIETCDKYDLELRFKPKHRSKIQQAKASPTFKKWDHQIKGKFGFIPLGDLVLPNSDDRNPPMKDIIALHNIVKQSGTHNFIGAQIEVISQLDPDKWQKYLQGYWDEQLCALLRYGFPLDFNLESPLEHKITNHSSAILYENDVKAYLNEEKQFKAIYGPFKHPPFDNMHFLPF